MGLGTGPGWSRVWRRAWLGVLDEVWSRTCMGLEETRGALGGTGATPGWGMSGTCAGGSRPFLGGSRGRTWVKLRAGLPKSLGSQ